MNILGFEFKRKQPQQDMGSVIAPTPDDGSVLTSSTSSYYGMVLDVDTIIKNENDLIRKYREIAQYSDCESAIDEIVNEAIVSDPNIPTISLSLDSLQVTDQIKEIITNEFEKIITLLNFDEKAYDVFRNWYIDGKIYYHIIVDETMPQNGILELRFIDPRKIRKIKNIQKSVGPGGVEIVSNIEEYFLYNNTGISEHSNQGIKLSKDTVIYCTSGEFDANTNMVLSHLHPAVKPCNQLKMMEDALVIYRITRSSERRIFYIDVGNLSKFKAEQYVQDIMNRYRNKVVYNACLDMNTLVPLLDGRTLSLYDIEKEFKDGKKLWAYSCDPISGKFAPGLITSAGVTRHNEPVMRLTLDNGKTITCTYDHKFPVWGKGKTEAKDLVIGDSMIPFYERTKAIHYKHPNSLYHQLFENNTKKWVFTHRLVSKWKDDNSLENELLHNETYITHDKNTIHHKNYRRLDNTPDNLIRMAKLDHFDYHKQHSSLSGKIGGKVTAQRKRENNLPMFNMTPEQRKDLGTRLGKIVGPKMVLEQKGIHGLTKEETTKNARLGGLAYKNKLLNDEEFATHMSNIRKSFWDDEKRKEWAERGKINNANRNAKFFTSGNEVRWNGEKAEQHKEHLAKLFTIKYTDNILDVVEKCAALNMSNNASIKFINENIDITLWQSFNKELISTGRNLLTSFTKYDLLRINKLCGYNNWTEYKTAVTSDAATYKNHKIINIEYLSECIDVGTLGIDKNEIYHNYHTFALDAGIYTCNSTGEVVDNKRHMAMVEDFFMPRREGGRGTEITTLPGGCLAMDTSISLLDGRELTITEIAEEIENGKELWSYSCDPKTGAIVPGLISWAGVTQKSAKVMKITLDNGESIIATPDHKWPQYGEDFKRTDELTVGDSLIPLYRDMSEDENLVYNELQNIYINFIECLDDPIEVGTLTIDSEELYHNYHTFALSCGVFTKNSNLADISDIEYFQAKLYKSLKVPLSRLQPQATFTIGRSSEISREEVKFNKFVERLRKKFSFLFKDALKTQLILKGIIRPDEWEAIEHFIRFNYQRDNYFSELKESEIIQQRIAILNMIDPYVGKYYSSNWVRKNVLMQSDNDMEEMQFELQQDQELAMQQQIQQQQMMAQASQQDPQQVSQQTAENQNGS